MFYVRKMQTDQSLLLVQDRDGLFEEEDVAMDSDSGATILVGSRGGRRTYIYEHGEVGRGRHSGTMVGNDNRGGWQSKSPEAIPDRGKPRQGSY